MPTHCTHLSLTEDTDFFHWAVTSGSLLLVHKRHYRRIAIKKGSTLWEADQKQGSASLRTMKTTVLVVTPQLDMELEAQTRVETTLDILLMAIKTSKPWGIF